MGAKRNNTPTVLHMTHTPVRVTGRYKPSGTLIIAKGNITKRIIGKVQDTKGRWSWIRIQGKQKTVMIYSCYIPGKWSLETAGPDTNLQQLVSCDCKPSHPHSNAWESLTQEVLAQKRRMR